MPDSGFVLPPSFRVVDTSINAVAGGSIEFYDGGTSSPKTVYSDRTLSTSLGSVVYLDSAGHPVSTQGGSTKVIVYTDADPTKVVFKDSNGVTLASYDNVQLAQDTSALSGGGSTGISGVLSKTADYTVLVADSGYWINVNPTSGAVTVTLPSAATAGNGFSVGIRHNGGSSTNPVSIRTVNSETIQFDAVATSAAALTGDGESAWLVSDGAGYTAVTRSPPRVPYGGVIPIKDRLSAPPASPVAGEWYLINSASPTGAWSSFAEHDLVRPNGIGGYDRYTPHTDSGWLGYVHDEDLLVQHRGTAWVDLNNITAPLEDEREMLVLRHREDTNTSGGTATANAWTKLKYNYEQRSDLAGASTDVVNYTFTVPAEKPIRVIASHVASFPSTNGEATFRIRLYDVTNSAAVDGAVGDTVICGNGGAYETTGIATLDYAFTPSAETEYCIQYYTTAALSLGIVQNVSGVKEYYGTLAVESNLTKQGPQGIQGNNGTDGTSAGIRWAFASSTTMGDPTSGKLRLNNATLSSVTAAAVSDNCAESGNPDVGAYVLTWDDSTTTANRGTIVLRSEANHENFAIYTVSGASTDNSGWTQLALTHVGSNGSFTSDETLVVAFFGTGNTGAAGAPGAPGTDGAPGNDIFLHSAYGGI